MKIFPQKYLIAILQLLYIGTAAIEAQDRFPASGVLYNPDNLARVDISINQTYLDQILAPGNEESDVEYMAEFTFTRGMYTVTIDSVGFRLRGNTSRGSAKKSFKVSLNTFVSGQKFQGVEKINLNGEHNDPSISRAYLSWNLFRAAGVPGSRAGHVELYINGEYKGVYINVEHVDEEFVDLRFGNNDGNLYKCLYPADLMYLGSDPELYKFESGGRRAYELKRNEEVDDYSDIANFIDVLNNEDPSQFQEKLEPIFNVNIFLKYMVLEVLLGHWDGYAYNMNNFYLYRNEGTGKFEFIPYDPDNTLGIDWLDRDWANRSIYSFARNGGQERPLYQRILENPVYLDRYSFYMKNTLDNWFNNTYVNSLCDHVNSIISDAAHLDEYKGYDWGYTNDDFDNSFDQAAGGHVDYGIKPYVSTRYASAQDELSLNSIDPVISLLYVNQPKLGEEARVEFLVEDDTDLSSVTLYYSYTDDFTNANITSETGGLYTFLDQGLTTNGTLRYYIEAEDSESNLSRDPYTGFYEIVYGTGVGSGFDLANTESISVYPNPASEQFYIDIPDGLSMPEYQLFDFSGRLVQSGILESSEVQIASNISNGIYLLKVEGVSGERQVNYSQRLIISR